MFETSPKKARPPWLRGLARGACLAVLAMAGCGDEGVLVENVASSPDPLALTSLGQWRLPAAGEDPFASHLRGRVPCGQADFREEDGLLEVTTRRCNYLTVVQPSIAPVAAGDRLFVRIWWQTLAAEAPASAELAIALGDRIVWQRSVPVPSPAHLHEAVVRDLPPFPGGELVTLHVRNHGYNSWRFGAPLILREVKQ